MTTNIAPEITVANESSTINAMTQPLRPLGAGVGIGVVDEGLVVVDEGLIVVVEGDLVVVEDDFVVVEVDFVVVEVDFVVVEVVFVVVDFVVVDVDGIGVVVGVGAKHPSSSSPFGQFFIPSHLN